MSRCFMLVLIIVLVFAVPACSSQGAELKSAIERAVMKTSEAQSYRAEGSSESITGSVKTFSTSFKTEVAAIDRIYSKTTGDSTWQEAVKDGERCYFREREGGPWRPCAEELEEGYYRMIAGVPKFETPIPGVFNLLAFIKNIQELGQEYVGGAQCTRYQMEIDRKAVSRELAMPESLPKWLSIVQIWIDEEDYIRRMDVKTGIPATAEHGETLMNSTIVFYDFGEDIEITLPEV
ncbi:MAG: hypothetical protein IBX68_11985 [Dehalococcoidia bacterium]|nr:hypothetical protein [Dehalococcoidia bacterium]